MGQNDRLIPEERARRTEIQEFLIDRYRSSPSAYRIRGNQVRTGLSAGGNKDSNHRFRGGRARRFVCRFSFGIRSS